MVVYGWHGGLGSTKTWGAVLFAWCHQDAGFNIVSDIELNPNYFPKYHNLDTDPSFNWDYLQKCALTGEPFPYERIYLLLDEFQYHSDSRMSHDTQSILLSYLFIQARKRKVSVGITSRDRGMIDLRDRESEDIIFKCYKKHANGQKCFDFDCELYHYAEWLIIDTANRIGKPIRFYDLTPIFPMYQTQELNAVINKIDIRKVASQLDTGGSV